MSEPRAKKILVCDDDAGILEVIKIMLEEEGYLVKGLANGKGIYKIINQFNPDLILLDLWMPGIPGGEVTKILKRDKKTAHIPIIIISALNDTNNISKISGADDFLPKPFDMNDLFRLTEKYVK